MTAATEMVLAGRYRLGPLLGRGGMAEVYEAIDERLARPVAVKLLLPEFAAQAGMRDRFEAEARSAARLSHPCVVAVFDSGEDDGTPFIVMERLPGETLADRMGAAPLEVEWLRGIARDVLGALGAAHAAGVVHRDVKPANILIAADGRAKVADFGIAKALEEAPSDLTGAHQLLGTPAYVAPERLDGLPATSRSDLYSFGVVLYEALAGERAFPGTTPLNVAYAIHNADPVPLEEVRPGLAANLVTTVERAMHRDPAARFATAAEMAAALEAGSAAGTAAAWADSTVAMASPSPASATVVMPLPADAGTASSDEATPGSKPFWARGLFGGLTAGFGRRTRLVALLIAGLVLIGVVALAAGGNDAGRPSGGDVTPTTTVSPQAPTTLPEVTTATPATTPAPATGPPAGGGSPGKGKGKGKR